MAGQGSVKVTVLRRTPCPDCGGPLVYGEGCAFCAVCGYTRC